MHKWQLTNVMVIATLPLPLLSSFSCSSSFSSTSPLFVSLSHFYSLCRLVALYKRQSGQRAGNCFHICDNHQHLHRSAATPAKQPRQQQQQQLQQHEAVNPRLPLSASAAQDAAACTAAAAVSVHLVVDPATFSCSMPHAACNNQLCPLVLLNERRRRRRRRGATLTWLTHLAEDDRA